MLCPPFSSKTFLTSATSAAFLMNEAATKSTPCSQPNFKSLISFSANAGNPTETSGKLTPLVCPNSPVFVITHSTSPASTLMLSTFNPIKPSSNKTVLPTFKSFTIPGYETANFLAFPTKL